MSLTIANDAVPEARLFQNAAGKKLPYRLLRPADGAGRQSSPLVLFYHGAGERGEDNAVQWRNGVEVFQQPGHRQTFPCYVVAPQCPAGQQWVNVAWSADAHRLPAEPSEAMTLSLELLAQLQRELPIDATRLYVTGVSMGGYGTWDAVTRHPDRFAAAIPICGGGDENAAGRLKDVPIWAFHGALDTAVKPQRSRNMIAAIKSAGGAPRYTEYPDVGHDSWVRAYREPQLMAWLFSQRTSAA